MAEAFAIGVPPWRFWRMTYRELSNAFVGAGIHARYDHKLGMFIAHQTEAFARHKKLPALGPLLRKLDGPVVMSNMSMRKAVLSMAAELGAVVKYRKKGEA